jgi:hypothetical protein
MLTIVGDVIEYDGKPFAIITMPLSGDKVAAIDYIKRRCETNPRNRLPMKGDVRKPQSRGKDGNLIIW